MKVLCVRLFNVDGNAVSTSPWATIGRVYTVLSISIDQEGVRFRVVGDEKTPALLRREMFEVVDGSIPGSWIVYSPGSGFLELAPEPWTRVGFWDQFFDGKADAVASFNEERNRILKVSEVS